MYNLDACSFLTFIAKATTVQDWNWPGTAGNLGGQDGQERLYIVSRVVGSNPVQESLDIQGFI